MIRLKLKGKVLSEERKEGLPERQEPKEKPERNLKMSLKEMSSLKEKW